MMNHTMKKAATLSALALTATFAAQSANAALITEWSYNVDSTFTEFTQSGSGGTGVTGSAPNDNLGGNTVLEWNGTDDAGAPSTVSITSDIDSPPNLVTNGGPEDGATFTHVNNVLDNPVTDLDTFAVKTQIDLTAAKPDTGDTQTFSRTFDSFFTESNNAAPCGFESDSTCDDIFVLTNANTDDTSLLSTDTFTVDDTEYTLSLRLQDLGLLSDAQCSAAGAASGCIGFLTQENQTNSFASEFQISAQQLDVPEPGSLALLGGAFSLIGFGLARRRSNRQG